MTDNTGASASEARLIYKPERPIGPALMRLSPFAVIGAAALYFGFVTMSLGEAGGATIIAFVVAAVFLIAVIVAVWGLFGPKAVFTRTEIALPGAFRTRRIAINDKLRLGLFETIHGSGATRQAGFSAKNTDARRDTLWVRDAAGTPQTTLTGHAGAAEFTRFMDDLAAFLNQPLERLEPNTQSVAMKPDLNHWAND